MIGGAVEKVGAITAGAVEKVGAVTDGAVEKVGAITGGAVEKVVGGTPHMLFSDLTILLQLYKML